MSARSRNLWVLLGAAAVALGLGLYAYFGVMKGEERDAERKRLAEQLVHPTLRPDGGTEQVRYGRLVLKAKGETTELARLPDQSWVITRPMKVAADVRTAEDMVGALQFARLKSTIEERPTAEDLQRFGLDHPSVEVTASAEGVPPLTVRLGKENPFDGSVYLQREGDPTIYAVQATTRATLDRSTFDLRDRDVIAVRDLGVTGVAVKGRKGDWALVREPEHPYAFVRPVNEEADTAAISSWLATLRGTKAIRFLQDSPAERNRTGVEKPLVEATFQRGKTETVHVRLAAGKGEADPAYVLREDQFGTSLAEVPRGAIAALDKGPAELRDRTVLHVKAEDVVRIRLGNAPTALVVERDRPTDGGLETWRLAGGGEVDPFKASSLLYGVTSLKAEPTDQTLPTDPKRTGLGPTARAITLEGKEGTVLGTIALGGPWTRPAGTFVRDDRGRVVLVDSARLREIPTHAADLRPPPPPPPPPPAVSALPGPDGGS